MKKGERGVFVRILVLTKNVLAEQELQQQLQELDHEVYCSPSECYQVISTLKERPIELFFDVVIPSAMLTNAEVEVIQQALASKPLVCLPRMTHSSKEQLREQLYEISVTEAIQGIRPTPGKQEINFKLSGKEGALFDLLQSKGTWVSRQEASRTLWEKEPTNSTLSQLSNLVKRINAKFEKFQSNYCIETGWKNGYFLDKKRKE